MDIVLQQAINGLTLGCIYAIIALGYTMVYGVIQLINFAHGDVVMIGSMTAYTAIITLAALGLPGPLVLVLALLLTLPVCMLIGWGLERLAYRPLRHAPRLAPLITAIGMSIILQNLALLIWGRNPLAFPRLVPDISWQFGGAQIHLIEVVIIVSTALLLTVLVQIIHKSRLGLAMRAASENLPVAALMGINTHQVIALTFIIGSGLAAFAGVMIGVYYGIAQSAMGAVLGLKAFCAAVLGGIGNLSGAVVGGLLLGVVEVFAAGYIGEVSDVCRWPLLPTYWLSEPCADGGHFVLFGSNYQDVFAFVVLVAVLVLRPSGLLGERIGNRD